MNIRRDSQILVARTGVFFANCDGEYDKLEDKFISEFVLQMIKDGIEIEDSLKEPLLILKLLYPSAPKVCFRASATQIILTVFGILRE